MISRESVLSIKASNDRGHRLRLATSLLIFFSCTVTTRDSGVVLIPILTST